MPLKQRAMEQRATSEAAKEADDAEWADAASWTVGAKDNSKIRTEEDKDTKRCRKAAEKAMLEAVEAEELSSSAKKGKDDFDLLNATLANQPKTKAQKEGEVKKAADEERRQKEETQREVSEQRKKVYLSCAKVEYITIQMILRLLG